MLLQFSVCLSVCWILSFFILFFNVWLFCVMKQILFCCLTFSQPYFESLFFGINYCKMTLFCCNKRMDLWTYSLECWCFIRYIHNLSQFSSRFDLLRMNVIALSLSANCFQLLVTSYQCVSLIALVVAYQIGMHIKFFTIFLYCFVTRNESTRVNLYVSSQTRSNYNWE